MEVVPLFPCNVNEPRLLHFVSPVLSKVLQGVERVLPLGAKDGRIRLPLYIPAYHAQLPQASLEDGIAELYNSWIEEPTYTRAPITVEVDVQGTTLYLDSVSLGIVARLVLFCVLKYGSLNIFTRLRVDVELMFKYAIQPVTANERIMELVAFQLTRGELNPWVFLPGAYANKQLATLLNAVTKTTSAFFAKPIAADTSDQESDHAPHTIKEKESDAPFGVPGLDTTLPLLLTASEEGKLTVDEIIQLCHTNPSKIFNVPTSNKTFVDVKMEEYTLAKKHLKTKCGWSPFTGRRVVGKVSKV
jgi:hypothetical protein